MPIKNSDFEPPGRAGRLGSCFLVGGFPKVAPQVLHVLMQLWRTVEHPVQIFMPGAHFATSAAISESASVQRLQPRGPLLTRSAYMRALLAPRDGCPAIGAGTKAGFE